MRPFYWLALLCVFAIGMWAIPASSISAPADQASQLQASDLVSKAAAKQSKKPQARCHIHGSMICCPGGCRPIPKKRRLRGFCHVH